MSDARRYRRGVLLAGGMARRFGGVAKGVLPFGDGRVCDAALTALHDTCDEVLIAANDPQAESWFPGHRVVRDVEAGRGALGALHTALRTGRDVTVVVCAWDLPFMRADVLEPLADTVDRGGRCCVPQHADGSLEPICAAYDASCADVIMTLLEHGERSAQAVWRAVDGAVWPIAAHLTPDDATRTFFNVNTPDDLARAESWLGAAEGRAT